MTLTVTWLGSAVVLLVAAGVLGRRVLGRGLLGILIDGRGRYSLSHFQVVLWSIVVLSLILGLFLARFVAGVPDALAFAIPNELLIVMGISLGAAATAAAIKSGKDAAHPERVAASNADQRPSFAQVFLVEEGTLADKVVDVSKFQNFWLTLILVAAYVLLVFGQNAAAASIADVVLPGFGERFLALLAVSHAGYLAGKLPDRFGTPDGLTLEGLEQRAVPEAKAKSTGQHIMTYVPRRSRA